MPNEEVTPEMLRDEGIAWAEGAQPIAIRWAEKAELVIEGFAATGRDFTADDVTAMIGYPASPTAVGGPFLRMAKRGVIERVGWKNSSRRACHARPMAVWNGRPRP